MASQLNAYFVDAGEHNVVADYIAGYPRYEPWRICDLVFAPTRNRAKSLFYRKYKDDIGEFTAIRSVRLRAKDVQRQEGFAAPDDPLWEVEGIGSRA